MTNWAETTNGLSLGGSSIEAEFGADSSALGSAQTEETGSKIVHAQKKNIAHQRLPSQRRAPTPTGSHDKSMEMFIGWAGRAAIWRQLQVGIILGNADEPLGNRKEALPDWTAWPNWTAWTVAWSE